MGVSPQDPVLEGLRHNFLFGSLSEAEIHALAGEVWVEDTPTDACIVRENDVSDALFVVLSGGVNVVKSNGQFLAYLGPGGFFGEMALFIDGSARTANCIAAKDTTCLVVRKHVLDAFCAAQPAAGLKIYTAIIRTLAERLQATSSDLAILMGTQVRSQGGVSELVEHLRKR